MKYNGENLKEVLKAHERWFGKSNGWTEDDRANLRNASLGGALLSGAFLVDADLSGAYMSGASLIDAYLCRAHLSGACLKAACLVGADLTGACLKDADLRCADLRGADLSYADLIDADLSCAELGGANLNGANLRGAELRCTGLSGAKDIPFIPIACPDTGAFIGWKKCIAHGNNNENLIVKLLIPEDAERISSTGRKCRADKAVVLEIQNLDGSNSKFDTAYSINKAHLAYRIGETVVPDGFDKNRWNECASGIHFFVNRQEAVDY